MTPRDPYGTDAGPYDAVVVGARCAGAATAMLLARLGHRVLVVDRSPALGDVLSTHGVARGGVVQLSRWGLLEAVLDSGAPAVRQVTFRTGDDEVVRPLKDRAGTDLLVAPRRHVLDPLLLAAAQEAGAEVRLSTTVTGVVRDDDGRVRGVTARHSAGRHVDVAARFVVGADGVRSKLAAHLGAAVLATAPRDSATFYAYVKEIGAAGFEFHVGAAGLAGVFPTHDDDACVWLCAPGSSLSALRSAGRDRAGAYVAALATVSPTLADRVRAGTVTSPVRGTVGLPNHLRQPSGPGWALVGDAGYHRDPVTGHGITDAFRDAELLARSLDDALRGRTCDDEALASFRRQRDAAVREVFDLTCALASYPPAAPFVQLQKQLGDALDAEADALAGLPDLPVAPAAPTRPARTPVLAA